MIRFACPRCKTLLSAADEHAGKVLRCGKCGATIRSPGPVPTAELAPPPASLSRPRQGYWPYPWLIAGGVAATGALILVAALITTLAFKGLPFGKRVYTHEEFRQEVIGLEARQLRLKMGPPDDILPMYAPAGLMTGEEFRDRLQGAAFGGGDPGYEAWVYRQRTREAGAAEPDGQVLVHLENGRVARVVPIR